MQWSEGDPDSPLSPPVPSKYAPLTLHQWRTQVKFEIPAEIPFAHELLMKMLQENMKIKKIYWGNLLLVYIYTKN